MGDPAIVEATVPTQPMAAVNTLEMAEIMSVMIVQFLSLDFWEGADGLGAGGQQTLEQTNAKTAQGDAHASQQQDRLARDGGSHGTDPADGGFKYGTDGGQQRTDSDGSNLRRFAMLLSLMISK